ncbi:MAG TPA: sulfate ABC transporter substrate-binding protein [Candidatus Limnocylindrales bacterium]|nr:sulfate ABC transporter substrate-binding protein [Candidatus Limnocylindrales bacterium]
MKPVPFTSKTRAVLGRHFALTAIAAGLVLTGASWSSLARAEEKEMLNVSYDPTRELWKEINSAFIPQAEKDFGVTLDVKQSHGGSSSQARAVNDGLGADVVTLAMWPDTDAIRRTGLIDAGWENEFPHRSLPYVSTIVFVVRKGNPKGIKDWNDIVQPGVEIITPNPKTSGNGKLSFLAAWGAVIKRGGSEDDAKTFVTRLYKQAPVLDTGARGATTTFAQKGIGDVQLAWENEAYLATEESGGELEIVYPSISILAEPHVAVVDRNADRHGTRKIAEAYLGFLYTPRGQEIIARHHYRPTTEGAAALAAKFPPVSLFPVTDIVESFDAANDKFFNEGKIFDQIYTSGR